MRVSIDKDMNATDNCVRYYAYNCSFPAGDETLREAEIPDELFHRYKKTRSEMLEIQKELARYYG